MTRPVLYVLAGVNGAGKSSVGGHLLERDGLTWFNPDTFARELKTSTGCDQETANAYAWQEGMRRLEGAIANGLNHAFETTLGGKSVTAKILEAAKTHDVLIWFCGLSSPELHIARDHDIFADGMIRRVPDQYAGEIRLRRELRQRDADVDGVVHSAMGIDWIVTAILNKSHGRHTHAHRLREQRNQFAIYLQIRNRDVA